MVRFNGDDSIVRDHEVGIWAYTMIVQYFRGAPNSIIFFGVSFIVTIVWYSENGRALKGATDILEWSLKNTIIGWLHT